MKVVDTYTVYTYNSQTYSPTFRCFCVKWHLSIHDYISGTIDFNLTGIPEPVQDAADCSLDQLPPEEDPDEEPQRKKKSPDITLIDLFHKKRVKGWWPVFSSEEGERELMVRAPLVTHAHLIDLHTHLQGKLELEVEILTEDEALLKPAGKARDDPNQNPHLEDPNRPATSFLWFTSPLKTLKHIIWKHYKWHIIGAVVIILLVILLVIFIYTAPVGKLTSFSISIQCTSFYFFPPVNVHGLDHQTSAPSLRGRPFELLIVVTLYIVDNVKSNFFLNNL